MSACVLSRPLLKHLMLDAKIQTGDEETIQPPANVAACQVQEAATLGLRSYMLATLIPMIRFLRQATSQATSATFMRCFTISACFGRTERRTWNCKELTDSRQDSSVY